MTRFIEAAELSAIEVVPSETGIIFLLLLELMLESIQAKRLSSVSEKERPEATYKLSERPIETGTKLKRHFDCGIGG